jgi:hypothetical protein
MRWRWLCAHLDGAFLGARNAERSRPSRLSPPARRAKLARGDGCLRLPGLLFPCLRWMVPACACGWCLGMPCVVCRPDPLRAPTGSPEGDLDVEGQSGKVGPFGWVRRSGFVAGLCCAAAVLCHAVPRHRLTILPVVFRRAAMVAFSAQVHAMAGPAERQRWAGSVVLSIVSYKEEGWS